MVYGRGEERERERERERVQNGGMGKIYGADGQIKTGEHKARVNLIKENLSDDRKIQKENKK